MQWSDLRFWKTQHDKVSEKVQDRAVAGHVVLPKQSDVFKAFELTEFNNVKVVILGQDPYHTKGYANGLAFSVYPHVKPLPPSLRNVLRELADDLGCKCPDHGDLRVWAQRGVLLLNSTLTVEEGKPGSHKGIGWEKLTYEALSSLSKERESLVFMLWGKHAQEYEGCIDSARHLVLTAGHPSPFSYHLFRGCKHFSKCNQYLVGKGIEPIDWKL